ncbi:hypothetical protein U1Q18_045685 [Sarracenia purpurea var. burkii]
MRGCLAVIAPKTSSSMVSKVLKMIVGALRHFWASSPMKSNMIVGLLVMRKLERSLNRTFVNPGILSTGVSKAPALVKLVG